MKRFDCATWHSPHSDDSYGIMEEHPDGVYVHYEDITTLVEAVRALITVPCGMCCCAAVEAVEALLPKKEKAEGRG